MAAKQRRPKGVRKACLNCGGEVTEGIFVPGKTVDGNRMMHADEAECAQNLRQMGGDGTEAQMRGRDRYRRVQEDPDQLLAEGEWQQRGYKTVRGNPPGS